MWIFVCLKEINAWMFVYRFLPVLFLEGNFSRETGSLNYKSNSSRKTKFRSIFRLGPRFHYYSNFDFSKPKWCEWYNETQKKNLGTVQNCFLTLFGPYKNTCPNYFWLYQSFFGQFKHGRIHFPCKKKVKVLVIIVEF